MAVPFDKTAVASAAGLGFGLGAVCALMFTKPVNANARMNNCFIMICLTF
jgi:hypothetical protein